MLYFLYIYDNIPRLFLSLTLIKIIVLGSIVLILHCHLFSLTQHKIIVFAHFPCFSICNWIDTYRTVGQLELLWSWRQKFCSQPDIDLKRISHWWKLVDSQSLRLRFSGPRLNKELLGTCSAPHTCFSCEVTFTIKRHAGEVQLKELDCWKATLHLDAKRVIGLFLLLWYNRQLDRPELTRNNKPGMESHQGGKSQVPSYRQSIVRWDLHLSPPPPPQVTFTSLAYPWLISLDPSIFHINDHTVWTLPSPFLPWHVANHAVHALGRETKVAREQPHVTSLYKTPLSIKS